MRDRQAASTNCCRIAGSLPLQLIDRAGRREDGFAGRSLCSKPILSKRFIADQYEAVHQLYGAAMNRRPVVTAVAVGFFGLVASCSRTAAFDLRPRFETLTAGDSLDQVRQKLDMPLSVPSQETEFVGMKYAVYRLSDLNSSYELKFAGAPGVGPRLFSKHAVDRMH